MDSHDGGLQSILRLLLSLIHFLNAVSNFRVNIEWFKYLLRGYAHETSELTEEVRLLSKSAKRSLIEIESGYRG